MKYIAGMLVGLYCLFLAYGAFHLLRLILGGIFYLISEKKDDARREMQQKAEAAEAKGKRPAFPVDRRGWGAKYFAWHTGSIQDTIEFVQQLNHKKSTLDKWLCSVGVGVKYGDYFVWGRQWPPTELWYGIERSIAAAEKKLINQKDQRIAQLQERQNMIDLEARP